jgi:putative transposase
MNWRSDGTFQWFDDRLRAAVRTSEDRDIQPTDAILNSQKVKTTEADSPRGYDAGKRIKGRTRLPLIDTLGLILALAILPADVQDWDGATAVLRGLKAPLGHVSKF